MNNLLIFIPKTKENNIVKFEKVKNSKKITENNLEMEEEIEILEDMIANSELASFDEIEHECADGFVITKNGSVKWNPKLKETFYYILSKKEQQRKQYFQEKRKNTLKLVQS